LSHISSTLCSGYFGDGVSQTISLGWFEPQSFWSWSWPPKQVGLQAWGTGAWHKYDKTLTTCQFQLLEHVFLLHYSSIILSISVFKIVR
jgi:hypothetical protein